MSEIITRLEVNCTTGETIEVPLTAEEIAQREADAAAYAVAQAEREAEEAAKAAQKATVLSALADAAGLSVDEVTAVLGF
jgi:cbb3-type cytochrome oxidase cytochrome c subunit